MEKRTGDLRRGLRRSLKKALKGFSPLEKLVSLVFLVVLAGAAADYFISEVLVPATPAALGLGLLWTVYLLLRARRARQADALEEMEPGGWEAKRPWEGAAPEEEEKE